MGNRRQGQNARHSQHRYTVNVDEFRWSYHDEGAPPAIKQRRQAQLSARLNATCDVEAAISSRVVTAGGLRSISWDIEKLAGQLAEMRITFKASDKAIKSFQAYFTNPS